ncbi:MAG: hypothetical protein JSS04_09060 [Proteobacteria bacterium]|nr:hypothetical protein [Pseudomonadota bacterium]
MFDVEVCDPKRVVLIRFRGELAVADFTALDAMGRKMQGGPPYDVIFDMTHVEKSHVATDFVSQRGELPQAFTDRERIYVVQHDDLKLLVKLYAAYQASKGWRPPAIVGSLDEALARLGVTLAEFGPPSAAGIL